MVLHRHKSSLEGFLDFSEPFSLTLQQNKAASNILMTLIEDYGPEQIGRRGYMPAMLVNATFEHVHTQSKDAFLNFFLVHLHEHLDLVDGNTVEPDISLVLAYLDGFSSFDADKKSKIRSAVELFADYMVDNFFSPLRVSLVKTPQPTPLSLSSLRASTPTCITHRVSILRQSCLIRDQSSLCRVPSRRIKQDGIESEDDDGALLRNEPGEFEYLEVAHILPHSLTSIASGNTELKGHTTGTRSDRQKGILFFVIDYFPFSRTLSLSPSCSIDPPSSRLLKVHRAIALILKLSGAGEYIENILRDMEEVEVKEDGSTNLGRLMSLRLSGWLKTLAVF
ncbi:hypothetical protein PAAG_06928 [Paracoccidioides lutzii Pb01]|uniref:HNH nuclease domain-containing protein n=1 Tax=Paracoccidioides lutzii (strain ATCC MYA-826 / Pb01) TaxID=502779 RepID=C1H8D2_PARBA|nr:hypothetical protein PAAG_06928 [Paracoccidioides lutzii Pb01]EEH36510.2 hypothetical protein PAAG_06928 [Paracoccidioides lutzii Pb01]